MSEYSSLLLLRFICTVNLHVDASRMYYLHIYAAVMPLASLWNRLESQSISYTCQWIVVLVSIVCCWLAFHCLRWYFECFFFMEAIFLEQFRMARVINDNYSHNFSLHSNAAQLKQGAEFLININWYNWMWLFRIANDDFDDRIKCFLLPSGNFALPESRNNSNQI